MNIFLTRQYCNVEKAYFSNTNIWHKDKASQWLAKQKLLDQWAEHTGKSFMKIHQHLTCEEHHVRCYANPPQKMK